MRTNPGITILILCMVVAALAVGGCTDNSSPARATAARTPAVTAVPVPAKTAAPQYAIPVQRIIVTNANSAELLIAIGAKDRIVGVSDTVKNHPVLGPQLAGVPSIGSWQTPDPEKILALRPDVVICYSSYLPRNIDKITASGITVLPIDCYKIDTMAADAKELGRITGREDGAAEYLAFLEKYKELIASGTSGIPETQMPRVYFESYSDYSTLVMGSGADSLVNMAGGRNIAALLPVSSPKVSPEWLLFEDPDVIIKTAASTQKDLDLAKIRTSVMGRPGSANLSAVKSGRVYVISNDLIYGPRAVIGAIALGRILHPEQFERVRPGKILDEYAGRFVPGTNSSVLICPGGD